MRQKKIIGCSKFEYYGHTTDVRETKRISETHSVATNGEQTIQTHGSGIDEHERWSSFLLQRFQKHASMCSSLLRKSCSMQEAHVRSEHIAKEDQHKLSLMFPGQCREIFSKSALTLNSIVDPEDDSASTLPWEQSQVHFERHLRKFEARRCRRLQADIARLEATTREGSSLRSLFNKQQNTISMLRKEIDRLQSRLKEIDAANGQRQASLKHQMGKLNDERHRLSEEVMAKTHTINHQSKKIEELASALHRCHTCEHDTQRSDSHLKKVEQQRDEAVQEANVAKAELKRWKEFYLLGSDA
eukprot:gb/GECG01009785.1/.p1 GENE.gb/GECG01009785.1/~~gb/GECG01009785.1/.p1  ORF type:complete len:301 (+),score=51.06 gb/GECG01009785.1/:1-903(+)